MPNIGMFTKPTYITFFRYKIFEFTIEPKVMGINFKNKNNLKGKNSSYNASKILEIFKGTSNEFSEAVALNVAAGLIVSG